MPAILVFESPASPIEVLEKRRRGNGSGYSDGGHPDQFAVDFAELDMAAAGSKNYKVGGRMITTL